jgi:choline dehydrogenase-like flavoprotein
VHLLPQTVASRVVLEEGNGRVSHLEYRTYKHPESPEHTTGTVRGRIFVIAANAIETPRLMLASDLGGSSGLMGRNLMDHAYLLSWGLLPEVAGTGRGSVCTSGIQDLRGGSFRRRQAAFSVDIHNDGWGWAMGSPYTDLIDMVDLQNKIGAKLRRDLADRLTRQLQLAFMVETAPSESNRVSVDASFKDALGNMRPVITYNPPEYTLRGVAYARELSKRIYARLGAEDHTMYDPTDYGYVSYDGVGYVVRGGNHLAGTHIMGTHAGDSVVDSHQRSWDHENLYLCGGGSMPSIGTANVTLTIAALCLRSAKQMVEQLDRETAPLELAVH